MTLTAHDVIVRPVISEKSMDDSNREPGHKYTFEVHPQANKIQVKSAVEELFSVEVTGVNVLWTKRREKRRGTRGGRIVGWTTPWRKAIVTVKPGQKIEFFEGV